MGSIFWNGALLQQAGCAIFVQWQCSRGKIVLWWLQCLHGDLTCRNILLNADYTVAKIGDLGLAKVMQAAITDANMGGTLAFAAPELLLNMRCNEKVIMFANVSTLLHCFLVAAHKQLLMHYLLYTSFRLICVGCLLRGRDAESLKREI